MNNKTIKSINMRTKDVKANPLDVEVGQVVGGLPGSEQQQRGHADGAGQLGRGRPVLRM